MLQYSLRVRQFVRMYVDARDRCRHPFVVASTIIAVAKYNGKVHSGTVLLPQSRVLRAYFPEMKSILSPAQTKIVRGHVCPDGVGRVALWFSLHLAKEGGFATSRSEDHHFKFLGLHCVFVVVAKIKKRQRTHIFFFFVGKSIFLYEITTTMMWLVITMTIAYLRVVPPYI